MCVHDLTDAQDTAMNTSREIDPLEIPLDPEETPMQPPLSGTVDDDDDVEPE